MAIYSILKSTAISVVGIITLIILGLVLVPLYQDLSYRFRVWLKRQSGEDLGIPKTRYHFPFGIPSLLNILEAAKNHRLLEFFQRQQQKNGVITVRNQAFGRFNIVTSDPENIKTILSLNFKDYALGARHGAFLPLLGDGIFTLDGDGWHHSRTLLRPQFTRQQISQLDTIEPHMLNLINILKKHDTTPVDVQKLFFQLTIDTATEFLFGESVDMLTGGNNKIAHAKDFAESFNRAQGMLANRIRAQGFYNYVTSEEFKRSCTLCKSFTDSFVQIALEKNRNESSLAKEEKKSALDDSPSKKSKKYVFLDELVKETQDPDILRDQSLNILLAGRDTTASLLSWVFYNLALYKPIFFKLREEVLSHFGTGEDGLESITFESLKACAYLRYVINETLRLYPIVPGNQRQATKDTYLPHGGHDPNSKNPNDESKSIFIPKGTTVAYSVYILHRNPAYWGEDSNEFKPERWAKPRPNSHSWDYLPFNGGPRICLGQQFALNEASYTIVRLLQTFKDIVPGNFGDISANPLQDTQLTMSVYNKVNLKFIPA